MRIGIIAAVAALSFAASAGAQSPAKVKFTLDWKFEGQTSFMWLGLERGYFQKEGLEMQVDAGAGSATAIQRIHTGAYDAGLGDISALIEYFGNNPGETRQQMVYLQYDEAPIAYYALKKSGLKSISDLAGKRVTGAPFEISRKMFAVFAAAAKIPADSVHWVTLDPSLRATAVIKGDADVCGGFMNIPLEFEQRGVKRDELTEMRVSDIGVRIYGNGVFVSSKMIQENPKAVAGLVRALNRSFKEGLADPVAAVKALKAREPLAEESIEVQRFRLLFPAILTPRVKSGGLGSVDKAVLAKQIDYVASTVKLKSVPTADALYNDSFLPPQAERMPLGK